MKELSNLELRILKLEKDVQFIINEFKKISPVIQEYLARLKEVVKDLENDNKDEWWRK